MIFYMFDSAVVKYTRKLSFKVENPTKWPEGPLFGEEYFSPQPKRWEPRYDNGYPNVFYDPEKGCYRCYYSLFSIDPYSEAVALSQRPRTRYAPGKGREVSLAYAESMDGRHWQKPALGLVEFEGNKDNNLIVRGVHGTSVFYDAKEREPARRYKMLYRQDGGQRLLAVAFSSDGFHFGQPVVLEPCVRQIMADTHNFVFYDSKISRYVLISRHWDRGIRAVIRMESEDFIHWTVPREIMLGNGRNDQIYSMPVLPLEDFYIGFPSVYHGGDASNPDWDCVDCELAYSADAIHWHRIAPGVPFIPRSLGAYPDGGPDCGCIYTAAPVQDEAGLTFYYMGGNGRHTDFRETSFLGATLRIGHFVCFQAGEEEGFLETTALNIAPSSLVLEADCGADGEIKVQVVNEDGDAIPGYTFGHSRWVKHLAGYEVLWDGHELLPQAMAVRLQFRFKNMKLFSFSCDGAFHNTFLLGLPQIEMEQ